MDVKKLKYPFLYAWDRKMGSFHGWSVTMQEKAATDNAPPDVIYHNPDRGWVRYSELERFEVKHEVWRAVRDLDYDAGPEPKMEDFNTMIEGRECTQEEADVIHRINELVAEYIKSTECGDPECETCKVGVANGVKSLNDAFNAGYKAGKEDKKMDEAMAKERGE